MVLHHIFRRAFRHLLQLSCLIKGFFRLPRIFLRYRDIMLFKLSAEFSGKGLASRYFLKRLFVDPVRITVNLHAALHELRLDRIDNGNDFLHIHIAGPASFFHHSGKVFRRHRIRHYCHIVFPYVGIHLPRRILHNVFCGLSLTFVSFVIHNCSRNVQCVSTRPVRLLRPGVPICSCHHLIHILICAAVVKSYLHTHSPCSKDFYSFYYKKGEC